MPAKKILLAGGGTGGHIYPAIAIAKAIKNKLPDAKILFAGTERGLENELVTKAGFPLRKIRVAGFRRKLSIDTLRSIKLLAVGAIDSLKILLKEKPDLVVGTGGYVSGPVLFFASLLKIPSIIHEQNVKPGITNQILSRFVDKIAVSFPDSIKYFPEKKTILTGNPLRENIATGDKQEALKHFGLSSDLPVVLSFGGSQGAASINEAIINVINKLKNRPVFQLIHITGKKQYTNTLKALVNKGIELDNIGHIIVRPYIHEMEKAYAACDLVVSRAGAITVSEISLCGKPSILIPLPTAANDHQNYNAKSLQKNGACVIIQNKALTGDKLYNEIKDIISDKQRIKDMSKASLTLAKPDALKTILKEIKLLLKLK